MRTTIESLVARVPEWIGLPLTVRPLERGDGDEQFLVSVEGRDYVVTSPEDRPALLGIVPGNEREAIRRASDIGVGPRVFGEMPDTRTLITERTLGTPLDADSVGEHLEPIVALLRRLHGSGPMRAEFPVHRVVEWHARDAGAHGVIAPGAYERLHQLSRRIEAAFAKAPMRQVPSHNNLLPHNLVAGEEGLTLLDYRFAGMNDVFFDLANVSVNADLSRRADQTLIEAYFGETSAFVAARLRLMKVMSVFRRGMWGVVRTAIGLDHEDAGGRPDELLRRAEHAAANPGVEQWLTEAGRPNLRDLRLLASGAAH